MKRNLLLVSLLLMPLLAAAQFENKISLNLSGGMFYTVGPKTWLPDWGNPGLDEDWEPLQIANFSPGVHASVGIQYNLNRHISIQVDAGMMSSGKWFYDMYDGHNYTEWAVWHPDDMIDTLMAEGNQELTLKNIGIGITPKYYLLPGKIVNPFLFAGVSFNFTTTTYEDNEWQALHDLDEMYDMGFLDPDDSGPDGSYMPENTGIGFNPGLGIEINFHDNIGFHIVAGYYLVLIDKENFYVVEQSEHLHAVTVQAGLKFSFLKSRDL